MFPGLSPIYINPQSVQTNVGPIGNDPGWSLAQSPNVTIPNIPATKEENMTPKNPTQEPPHKNPPVDPFKHEKEEREKREKEEREKKEKKEKEEHGLFHGRKK